MKIILLGPPGAGKGTIAKVLNQYDGSVPISTGDILRAAVTAETDLGKQVASAMKSGQLVSDEVIMGIMESRLQQPDCKQGYLLDGFPRTIPQAEALNRLLDKLGEQLDCVLQLDVAEEVIIDRLTTRRTCSQCGEIYNIKSKPPRVDGVCDVCGGAVVQRDDETREVIENRLQVYTEQTAPLVDFYRQQGLLLTVQGSDSDVVIAALEERLAL